MRFLAIFLLLATTLHAQISAAVDNTGREALTNQLDDLAAQETAARREAVAKIHTRAEALGRQKEVRARMIALLGGAWPEHSPLNPRITGASDHEGIHIERILFDSQPNFPVTALLYLPKSEGKLPAILMAPGHSPAGKAGDAAFALAFAHRGFAVLSYDPIGQGERLQYPDPANPGHTLLKGPTGEHGEAGLQPTLIGDALARYFLIDAVRAIDYLLTRPEIDAHRIGAFGCSGGGLMTALTAALDTRIAVAGVACFTTSFDTLLPSIGPQDSEQSTPDFISSEPAPSGLSPTVLPRHGKTETPFAFEPQPVLDFPDWSELFAPKPYAIIATTEDMFPFAGAQATEREARAFYGLFNAQDKLAFITGPGHHGNLRPILPQILDFFTTYLHPDPPNLVILSNAKDPLSSKPPTAPIGTPPAALPPANTQVTPTGQVSTSYPQTETIYTLNLKRFAEKTSHLTPPGLTPQQNPSKLKTSSLKTPSNPTVPQLQRAIREVTHATAPPASFISARNPKSGWGPCCKLSESKVTTTIPKELQPVDEGIYVEQVTIHSSPSFFLPAIFVGNEAPTDCVGKLLVEPRITEETSSSLSRELVSRMIKMASDGHTCVLALTPRPSPAGTEETKSPVLGTFYLTELRAELAGHTLMGLRINDVIMANDYLAYRCSQYPQRIGVPEVPITAEASGHMALVLLHAAILDPRLKHITLHDLPPTYADYLHQPIPHDAPQDILPGVLLHYDIPDLFRALGPRVSVGN